MRTAVLGAPNSAQDLSGLSEPQFRVLRILNVIAVTLMFAHDLDHPRVILTRGYSFHVLQLVPVTIAYAPSVLALVLAVRRSHLAALGSFMSGSVIVAGVILIHAVGMSVINRMFAPFFLEWGLPYCTLKVDYLTWASFWSLFVCGVVTLVVGFRFLLGQLASPAESGLATHLH